MRALTLAAIATGVMVALSGAAPAAADPGAAGSPGPQYGQYPPPFVDRALWTQWNHQRSLRVYPTPAGRAAARQLGSAGPDADEAWSEVLALAPDAATPGMREQFLCQHVADPPPVLYLKGRRELLASPGFAVVGSRNATAQGVANAESFARALADVQPALECRQRVHHAVGVLVRESLATGLVAVLKHAYPVVLEDDLVLIRVRAHRVGCHGDPSWSAALSQIFVKLDSI